MYFYWWLRVQFSIPVPSIARKGSTLKLPCYVSSVIRGGSRISKVGGLISGRSGGKRGVVECCRNSPKNYRLTAML